MSYIKGNVNNKGLFLFKVFIGEILVVYSIHFHKDSYKNIKTTEINLLGETEYFIIL